ncbi:MULTISPECIES: sulfatase family protein [unclassified Saccharicrinis]|uniref:sulfatase family protein n=1 Tax=unclassified Saccharicrinis TaxID=2646859 RepID=UPI003D3258C9
MQKLLMLLSAIIMMACSSKSKTESIPPNVVYILTDQWRAQALGYAGDPNVKTPRLGEFAKEAVNFANAVSVAPVCTPHRAALMTGRYPTSTGMIFNDLYLPSDELCMAEIFKAQGYNTAHIGGKWHLDGHGRLNNAAPERRQGFDFWLGSECSHDYANEHYYENDDPEVKYYNGYSPYAIANAANDYMTESKASDKPFLLFISIGTPHFPHHSAPKEMMAMYPKEDLILSPNVPKRLEKKTREELLGYYGHCTSTDIAIGDILDKMKELELMENTIFVFTSDHGEMMGSHGERPYKKQVGWDESIKVPFLISYPSIGKNKGAVVNAPINTPDILPSLLGLANLDIPETIEREDISELIQNPDPNADRAALVMGVAPFADNARGPEYRLIRTKQYTYQRTLEGPSRLFDNIKDPYQMNNLVGNPEFAELQKILDDKLNMSLEAVGDDFKPRDYYIKKWDYILDEKKNCIDHWSFVDGKGVVQSPKKL